VRFAERLEKCESIADIFELVKEAVLKHLGTSRAGLTLVLALWVPTTRLVQIRL